MQAVYLSFREPAESSLVAIRAWQVGCGLAHIKTIDDRFLHKEESAVLIHIVLPVEETHLIAETINFHVGAVGITCIAAIMVFEVTCADCAQAAIRVNG